MLSLKLSHAFVIAGALAASLGSFADPAFSGSSGWQEAENSRVRLISARSVSYQEQAVPMAGLQIELTKGWKTYWRTPGDGLAMEIDTAGSENVIRANILWPAPKRFDGAGGITSYGYKDAVTLPILIEPDNPGQPMRLRTRIVFGVCADLCIPVEISQILDIPAQDDNEYASLLSSVLRKVPRKQANGAPCPHRFIAGKGHLDNAKPELIIETAYEQGASDLDLFAERGDGLSMPPAMPEKQAEKGKNIYRIRFDFPEDAETVKGELLTLTMTSDQGSCETTWRVK